jgi:hypothetical protein
MGAGNLSACYFFGIIFETFLGALYLFSFAASMYFLFNVRGRRVQPNKFILAMSIVLFIVVCVVRPVLHLVYRRCLSSSHSIGV